MFLSAQIISSSLSTLKNIHPFYGTTFLVCKRAQLPVGNTVAFSMDKEETKFLTEYFRPYPESGFLYRVFRLSDKEKHWVDIKKYASSTLQSMRTRGYFAKPFKHERNTELWGWSDDYIEVLRENLSRNLSPHKGKPIPAFDMAVWLYREHEWALGTQRRGIIDRFFNDFSITHDEAKSLFDVVVRDEENTFQDGVISMDDLQKIIKKVPNDVHLEEEGTLAYLELQGVGPAKRLVFEPAERLSLITGDNGLGKTFLLECAWWALTGQWANPNLPAYPRQDAEKNEPKITFQISSDSGKTEPVSILYDWESSGINKWRVPPERPTIPGLLIYARVDGSFAVCDPAGTSEVPNQSGVRMPQSFVFTREQVWDGYDEVVQGQKRSRINGLIADFVSWQNDPDQKTFEIFKRVLSQLSPPSTSDLGDIKVGQPVRLPDDSRRIPTLIHPYGTVPIVHAAAGVKRILTLAYLLVWAWNEHLIKSEQSRRKPQSRIVFLIDEIEAHLHPQWQRHILPSLLEVKNELARESNIKVQFIVATHSPLVMASSEPSFDYTNDKLFHLDIVRSDLFGTEVQIEEMPFNRYGLIDYWLMSEVFRLKQARSIEAEVTIEKAKRLQQEEKPAPKDVQEVHDELKRVLAELDTFWPRWTYFAETKGVQL